MILLESIIFSLSFARIETLKLKEVIDLYIICILYLELYLRRLKFFAGQRGFLRLL
jgi:hypothetical protein